MSDLTLRSDQWDIRLNFDGGWPDVNAFVDTLDSYVSGGSVRYLHVSGLEIGTNPSYTSFGKQHIHVAGS